jgi:hypothetical protein
MSKFAMPAIYLEPFGTPLYWGDEQSGVLKEAIRAFYDSSLHKKPLAQEHLELVRHYLAYVIHAPCWLDDSGVLAQLRREVNGLTSVEEMNAWLNKCLEIGVDPL